MEDNKLATELLHEIKAQSKRWFILFLVTIILLFISNALWLYAWCLPVEESTTTTQTTVESNDSGNANYLEGNGDILNGKSDEK